MRVELLLVEDEKAYLNIEDGSVSVCLELGKDDVTQFIKVLKEIVEEMASTKVSG